MNEDTPAWEQIVGEARRLRTTAERGSFDPDRAVGLARAILAFDAVIQKGGSPFAGFGPDVRKVRDK